MADEPSPPTKVKIELGAVTIEIESQDIAKSLLELAMAAYREVAALPPVERPTPLPGTTDAQVELAGPQPFGFTAETT